MSNNRSELIMSLAGAMGMSGRSRKDNTSFDPSTGTFYCGSHVYQPSDIAAAKDFLGKYRQRLSSLNDASCRFYDIALSSIELVEKGMLVTNGGKLVVKDGVSA